MTTKSFAKVLIINDAGELLCLRRSASDFDRPGGWDFPGGTLEPDEGFTAAVVRETLEEAGISLLRPQLVYSKSDHRPWGTGIWLYYVEYVQGRPDVMLSDEHDQAVWMRPEAFLQASDYPKHHEIIMFLQRQGIWEPSAVPRSTATARTLVMNGHGDILMLRRSATDPFYAGAWDLPGGRVEPGEDIHEGALRETAEEAGLSCTQPQAVFAISQTRPTGIGTWVFFGVHCDNDNPTVTLSLEHDDYQWVPLADLPKYTSYDVLIAMHRFVATIF
jgi:8-oxo-dGTP pyrophosphatase MutT (NUDIX family)